MISRKKKSKISAKSLLKFSGILIVCIYVAYILIQQQMTLSTIEETQNKHAAAISGLNAEGQALEDELKKAESVNQYMEQVMAENEKEKQEQENSENADEIPAKKSAPRDSQLSSAEDEYIEQLIRDRLGYVKPNERIFIDISRNN